MFELEEHGRKPGYNEYVFATHRAFRKNMKNPPGLVGPEHTKIDGYLPSGKLLDKLAGVGNHLYGSGDFENPDSLTPSMKTAGIWARGNEKMLFMTEYGKLKDAEKEDCIKLGQIILNAFLHGGVSAYWHWDLFWYDMPLSLCSSEPVYRLSKLLTFVHFAKTTNCLSALTGELGRAREVLVRTQMSNLN